MDDAIPSDLFSYRQCTFTAEDSTIRANGYRLMPSRGFKIRSIKTGNVVEFRLTETQRDNEGDIQYWRFIGSQGLHAMVFND